MTELYKLVMSNFQLIGFIVIVIAFFKDNKQFDIKLDGIAKFVGLMVLLTLVKLALKEVSPNLTKAQSYNHKLSNFLLVFLEDAFFVMIPYYINKLISRKKLRGLVWIFFSLLFASGHLYQGTMGFVVAAFYPYFISYKYSMKTSFATVMCCHFMWDCFQVLTPKIYKLLQFV